MLSETYDITTKYDHLIIDSQYFACVNSINISFQFSNIKIEQYENWQKMSFRNRMVVAGSNGPVHLSVPLEKGRDQRQLVKDVKISQHEDWQKQHWRTIESCYSRSPFFEFYRDGVWELMQKKQVFLLDMNMAILAWLQKMLKNQGRVSLTENYVKEYAPPVKDLRNHFLPKNYQEMPFSIRYTQVFEDRIGFCPNLSILDLLFCCGPNAKDLLKDCKLPY
jgi:hypothetical protein